jgi:hypothetical protein
MWLAVGAVLTALFGGCTPSAGERDAPSVATRDAPPAAAPGPTLSVSRKAVHAGDVIELGIESPRKYTWGEQTSLEEWRAGKWKTVYYWSTWGGEESRITEPFAPRKLNAFHLVGFIGDASFKLRIPDLPPGKYRISKGFSTGPNDHDDTKAEVEISVVS